MGFLSNIKNKMTGGAATVSVVAPAMQRGRTATIQITAMAKSNAKVSSVYLQVRAVESAQLRDHDFEDGQSRTEIVSGHRTSFETKITVAGAQQLEDDKSYEWIAQLEIPTNVNASFNGRMIEHRWEILAGLEMSGNDPDSGWQPINVM